MRTHKPGRGVALVVGLAVDLICERQSLKDHRCLEFTFPRFARAWIPILNDGIFATKIVSLFVFVVVVLEPFEFDMVSI